MEGLLYYPYINLPESDWTIRILLYYENLGTIVPQEYFYNPEKHYNSQMLELVRDELVIPINPTRAIDNIWSITQPLIEYIQNPEFNIEEKRRNFELGNDARIHYQKFDYEVFYQLEQLGLAKATNNRWYIVEQYTASYLMSFLATIISSKLNLQPITDKIVSNKTINNTDRYNRKRETILRELIPFPTKINLKKLRQFKDKYSELLVSFKNTVEQIVLDESIEEGTSRFNLKIEELELNKLELTSKMNESKLGNIIFGSVCGIIGAIQGLATAKTPGAIIGGLPGFVSAIHSALQLEKAEDVFDQTGMKYLALADKKLR